MTQYSISDGGIAGMASAVGTLPESFRLVSQNAQVQVLLSSSRRLVDSSDPDLLGVVVVVDSISEADPLLLGTVTSPVHAVDWRWASNPTVRLAASRWRERVAGPGIVDSRASFGLDSVKDALAQHLALLDVLIGEVDAIRSAVLSDSAYLVRADIGDLPVSLIGARSRASRMSASVRWLGPQGAGEILVPDPSTAEPAIETWFDLGGAELSPTVYESGHRASLIRLHKAIESGKALTDLEQLARIHRLLADR